MERDLTREDLITICRLWAQVCHVCMTTKGKVPSFNESKIGKAAILMNEYLGEQTDLWANEEE